MFQRVHRQHLRQVTGCVCRSGTPTAVTVTTCTTASKASLGRSRAITVSRSGEIWPLSTAERRWSSSGTSTTPKITTFGSASPGTATVSIAGSFLMSPTPICACALTFFALRKPPCFSWLGLDGQDLSGLPQLGTRRAQCSLPPRERR